MLRFFLIALAASIHLFLTAETGLAERPNVILIMTDDQGYGDFGFTGNRQIETPAMDRLAEESMWLDKFYVCPVCAPTRASLMTGRYHYRTRVVDTYAGRAMMETSEVTLAELLGEAGYRTGIFGKWHLGDCYPMRPQDQGFQVSLVHRGGGIGQNSDPIGAEAKYTDPVLQWNGVEQSFKGFCTDVYYQHAKDFITESAKNHTPFFAYLPDNCPHGPFGDVPQKWLKHYQSKDRPAGETLNDKQRDRLDRIFAMISNIDQNIGDLLQHVDELGLSDNTIIVFLTDNGPNTRRYVAGFKGMKSSVYEGGIRTPLLFRWPAKFPNPAKITASIHAHIDILPTLLEACNIEAPGNLDGRSFLPALRDPAHAFDARTLFIQTHRGNRPQRYHHFAAIGNQWKLVNHSGFSKQTPDGEPNFELYDLLDDPFEKRDLASRHPERVAHLKTQYDKWFDDVGNERPRPYIVPRIVVGKESPTSTVLTRQDLRSPNDHQPFDLASGWWLKSAEPVTYDIKFAFKGKHAAKEAELTIGSVKYLAPYDPQANSASFKAIPFPAGEFLLTGVLSSPTKKSVLVHQVFLRRNE